MASYFTVDQIRKILERANQNKARYEEEERKKAEEEKARVQQQLSTWDAIRARTGIPPGNMRDFDYKDWRSSILARRSQITPQEDVYAASKQIGEETIKSSEAQTGTRRIFRARVSPQKQAEVSQKPVTVQGANADKPAVVNQPAKKTEPYLTVQGANADKPSTVEKPTPSHLYLKTSAVTVRDANRDAYDAAAVVDEIHKTREAMNKYIEEHKAERDALLRELQTGAVSRRDTFDKDWAAKRQRLNEINRTIGEYQNRINQLTKSLDKKESAVEYDAPTVAKYETVKNNTDYDRTVASVDDVVKLARERGYWNILIALDKGFRRAMGYDENVLGASKYSAYDYISEDELNTVKYYLAKNDVKSAEEYLKALKSKLNEREATKISQKVSRTSYVNPALGVLYGVAAQFSAPQAFAQTLATSVSNFLTGKNVPVDTNAPEFLGAEITKISGEQVAKRAYDEAYNATGSEVLAKVAQSMAGIGNAIAQNIPRILIAAASPEASLAIMATSVAGSTTKAMLDDGATVGQALVLGTAAGAIEYATEKIHLDNLLDIIKSKDSITAKKIAASIAKQAATEAAEESISEIANTVVDILVRQDESEFNKYVDYLMDSKGHTKEKAQKEAIKQLLLFNTLEAAAGGAVSGAFFGASASLVNYISTSKLAYDLGKDIKSSGKAREAINTVLATFNENSQVYKIARMYYDNPDNIPSYILGKLVMTINDYSLNGGRVNKNLSPMVEDAIYSGSMSNKQADAIINELNSDANAREGFALHFGTEALDNILKGTMAQRRLALRAALASHQAFVDNADIIGRATDLYQNDTIEAQKYLHDTIRLLEAYIDIVRNTDVLSEAEKTSAINNGIVRVNQLKDVLEQMRNKRYNIAEQIDLPAPVASVKEDVPAAPTETIETATPDTTEITQVEAVEDTPVQEATQDETEEATLAQTPTEVAPESPVTTEEKESTVQAGELPTPSESAEKTPVTTEENEAKPTTKTESAPVERKHDHTLIISAGENGKIKAKLSKYVRKAEFNKIYKIIKNVGGTYSDGSFIIPNKESAQKLRDYFDIYDPNGILQEDMSDERKEILEGTGRADTQGAESEKIQPAEVERGTGETERGPRGMGAGGVRSDVGLADEAQSGGETVPERGTDDMASGERATEQRDDREGNGAGGPKESSAVVTETQTEVAEETQTAQEEAATAETEETAPAAKNYRIDPEDIDNEPPSIYGNIEAIKTLKQIESENRQATPEEQKILAMYKGWGGLADAFINSRHLSKLLNILTYDEFNDARATVNNAFYTSARVIKHMYGALKRMGFKGGNLLEPSMGVGNFFGLIPKDLAGKTNLYGVEIDSITGRIAQQLYPEATIYIAPYQDVPFANGSFDVAIGNVPFLDVYYKYDDGNKYMLHDYFFIKTLDKVKDNGIVMFLTSTGTLDKQNSKARKVIAEKADLIAAARLPNNAFKKNAGTSVTTDLIILKKRPKGVESNGVKFENVSDINGIPINEYFVEHPENILGKLVYEKGMYAHERTQVEPEGDLDALMKKFVESLPKNIIGETTKTEVKIEEQTKNGYYEIDGKYYFIEKGEDPVEITGIDGKRVAHFVGIKNAYNKLLEMIAGDYTDAQIKNQQDVVRDLYNKMISDSSIKFGKDGKEVRLNHPRMQSLLRVDVEFSRVSGLERYDQKSQTYVESDILTKPIKRAPERTASTAVDAIKLSMSMHSKVDMDFIQKQTGLTKEQILRDAENILFETPAGEYEIAPLYLSGNVRQKLAEAEKAAKYSGRFKRNVEALKAVIPEDIGPARISPQLGAAWIPVEVYASFVTDVLGAGTLREKFYYDPIQGTWVIPHFNPSYTAASRFGTARRSVREILDAVMNLRTITIYDKDGSSTHVNVKATEEARIKADALREAFENWIFQDDARREAVVKRFNELFNYYVAPDYSLVSEYLDFSDINPDFNPRDYQKNVVARMVFNSGTLIAHGVGTGKTAELIMGAHQLKKLGRVKKPMFVVPLTKTSDFREEFLRIYPTANILTITDKDAEASRRSQLLAQIASNDWDAVIIGHSTFGLIPVSVETPKAYIQNQINEIEQAIRESTAKNKRDSKRFVRQLEKTKKALEAKLEALLSGRKDTTMTFEELGVDALFVDEAHNFKNLSYYTKLNVAGAQGSDARRAEDLHMKTEYIRSKNGVIVFATATPITNSVAEMYNMLRFVGPSALEESGVKSFDAWASSFGKVETAIEMGPDGVTPRVKDRFSKFRNVTAMVSMFRQFADIKKTEDVITNLPKAIRVNVEIPASDIHKRYIEQIQERMSNISGRGQNREDNMLLITNDGRAMATDLRLVASQLEGYSLEELDLPDSKINMAVKNIKAEYDRSNSTKGTQFVFLDFGRNESRRKDKPPRYDFNLYEDLINKLVAAGIPRNEIAVFQDYKKDEDKKALYAKMNNGEIRVLIGSTQAMGEGVNAHKKSVALHHINPPFKASDKRQREGRTIRHGNENSEVRIYTYIQVGSFDSYMWQMLERKAEMTDQAIDGVDTGDEIEDVSDFVLSLREAKAIASGNPLLMEKFDLETKIRRLRAEKRAFDEIVFAAKKRLKELPDIIRAIRTEIANYEADIKTVAENQTAPVIRGKQYEKPSEAGKAIIGEAKKAKPHVVTEIGTYRGLKLSVYATEMLGRYQIWLDGKARHVVEGSSSDTGVMQRIKYAVENFGEERETRKQLVDRLNNELKQVKEDAEKKFPKQDELNKMVSRLSEINSSLRAAAGLKTDDAIVDASSFGDDEDDDVRAYMGSSDDTYGTDERVPKSLTELRQNISARFRIPISSGSIATDSGKPLGRNVRGIFKKKSGAIRVREINELSAIAHELGHAFAKKYPAMLTLSGFEDVVEHYRDDLEDRGYKPEDIEEEAFAEYIATALRNIDTAIRISPEYFSKFIETFNETDRANFEKTVNESNEYFSASRKARQEASIRSRLDEGTIRERIHEFMLDPDARAKGEAEKFAQDWYDQYTPIKSAEYELTGGHSVYDRFQYINLAGSKVHGAYFYMLTDVNGNYVAPPLIETIKRIVALGKNAIKDFDLYLKNRRAAYLVKKDIKVYESDDLNDYDKLQKDIERAEAEYPEFSELADELYEFQDTVLWEYAVKTGLASEELFNKLTGEGRDYIPLTRVMDKMYEQMRGGKRGAANQKTPIYRIKGSSRDTYSPLENILINIDRIMRAGLKNEAARRFADIIDQSEDSAVYMEKIQPSKLKQVVSTDALKYRLEQALGKDEAESILSKLTDEDAEALLNIIMSAITDDIVIYKTKNSQKPNVITVMRGGKPDYYEVHSETLYKALTASTPQNASFIAEMFAKGTHAFKLFTTALNPYFVIPNIQRDFLTGAIKSTTANNLLQYTADLFSAFFDMIRKTDEYKLFLANGGHWASAINANKDQLAKVLKDLQINGTTRLAAIRRGLNKLGEIFTLPMEGSEQVPRFAEFKRKLRETNDVIAAARAAQEVTTNFHRRGLKSKEVDMFIPYFQTAINGLGGVYEAFVDNKKYDDLGIKHQWFKLIRYSMYGAVLTAIWNSLIAPLLFKKKPEEVQKEYEQASAYMTNNYYSFYFENEKGEAKFIRIAKPREFGAIATFFEDLIQYYIMDNEDAFAEWGTYVATTFLPSLDVIGVSTAFQLAANEDGLGRKIVPDAFENLPAKYQYNENTSKLAVMLGGMLNLSPLQIDKVLSSNFGFVGRLAKAFPVSGKIDKTLGFGSVLYYDPVYSTDIINNLYNTRNAYLEAANGYKVSEGKDPDYSFEDVYNAHKYTRLTSLYSSMNKLIREDEENGREARRQLNAYLDAMLKAGMTKYDKALANIAEVTGVELGDISPYPTIPQKVDAVVMTKTGPKTVKDKDGQTVKYELTYPLMFQYFKYTHRAILEAYDPILRQDNTTYEAVVEQLKEAKKRVEKQYKQALGEFLHKEHNK